ncbi:MAG: hypothetical protein ACREQ2_23280 [Candidatus Binatia bacterium]
MVNPLKRILQNLFLAGSSLSLALLIVELVGRFVIEPVNFLRPQLINDSILGHAIRPASGGHDAWGFRNRSVPVSAKIVTVGDSQTYGASAPAKDSWPSILSELSKRSVYNLSLGGYGPVQYFHLLTSKAVQLSPGVVIVGFYLGNDLLESYELVQNNPHWVKLKRSGSSPLLEHVSSTSVSAQPTEDPASFFPELRTWLAQRSIIYNILIYSVVGEMARLAEAVFVSRQSAGDANVRYDKKGIYTGFTPERRLKALDLKDPRVNEGLLISLDLFARMKAYCLEHAIHLLVVLIPTKESVYARYLENDPAFEKIAAIKSLLINERTVTAKVKAFFEDHGIAYINLLPQLQERVARLQLYPGNFDGHPNQNGYRVIAESVEEYLRQLTPQAAGSGHLVPIDHTASGPPSINNR